VSNVTKTAVELNLGFGAPSSHCQNHGDWRISRLMSPYAKAMQKQQTLLHNCFSIICCHGTRFRIITKLY
jgi:hypothetical protein